MVTPARLLHVPPQYPSAASMVLSIRPGKSVRCANGAAVSFTTAVSCT